MSYYSLHNHTDFSNASCGFMDSINKTEDLINHAFEIGLKGLAITDHESVSAHVRAVQHYKSMLEKAETEEERKRVEDFRLLLGNEVYLARPDLTRETHQRGERFYHFILIAKDKIGQKQIRELSSRAWGRAYYMAIQRRYNIKTDFEEIIAANRGHVVATTACLGGPTAVFYKNYPEEEALILIREFLERMSFVFGNDNFFIELAPSKYQEQIDYNMFMYKHFGAHYNFIISTDSHYLTPADFEIFKVALNSGDGEREVDEFYKYSHMMTWDEVASFFTYFPTSFIEKCRRNTISIGESAEFYDLKEPSRIPRIPMYPNVAEEIKPVKFDTSKYENIHKFATSKYPQDRHYLKKIFDNFEKMIPLDRREKTMQRIDLELSEVWGISEALDQRMSDYLLTVAKVIEIMWNEADAIVGPGRGSAVAFITNYLLGITQLNPLEYPVEIPHWRFIEKSRPDLPDIDIDTPGNKREGIIREVAKYFESIGGSLTQICTYGTEGAKSAVRTAARGLNLEDEVAMYISSLISSERGIQLSLDTCYYGDEEHEPIRAFVLAMDTYPELWKVSKKLEGLITRIGIHAAGVILGNQSITEHNSVMRTSKGFLVTAYDLHDSEYLGEVKYDFLSIDGLGKINAAINFMLKDNVIEWKGSLKETYTHYLWPNKLKYTPELWANIASNEINSLWQLNTDVGSAALSNIHASSLKEIGIINSLMRLQPQNKGDEQPLKTYERFRDNIREWYQEMVSYGLSPEEIDVMKEHLEILNGVADTQESVMLLVMDPRISGFSVAEANKLRKGIAKKSVKAQEEAKQLLFSKGQELGTSRQLLNYVWDVQISRQLGYSFSLPHVAAYSIIAMQQANLYTYFPSIYWNTACLTIDAGANQEEDLQDLIKLGYIKLSDGTSWKDFEEDEEGTKEMATTSIDRGRIAATIGTFQKTIEVVPPDVNASGFGFMPDRERNVITCGLKIVSKIGDQLIYNIIFNRPYVSFDDFLDRVVISKDRVVNLIKANAFRNVDDRDPMTLLKDFVKERSDLKKKLTLQNTAMLINKKLIPNEYGHQIRTFNWVKYLRNHKHDSYYKLDDRALAFYDSFLDQSKLVNMEINGEYCTLVDQKYVKKFYDGEMAKIKSYIVKEHDSLLEKLNEELFMAEWEKYKMDNLPQGEMQSMRIYVSGHELDGYELPYNISKLSEIVEGETDGQFYIEGKFIPRYVIHHISGTVIDKDKTKSKITVLTQDGPVDVKIWKNQFAHYDQTLVEQENGEKRIIQPSFFEIGTLLILTGIKRGNTFALKKYKNTKIEDTLLKINLVEGGVEIEQKIKQEDLHS